MKTQVISNIHVYPVQNNHKYDQLIFQNNGQFDLEQFMSKKSI